MFVSNLSVEKWVGNKNEGYLIENPSFNQVEEAIGELDGKTKTLVTLGDDEAYMSIGGGNSGKYIVTATLDNESFYTLLHQPKYDIKTSISSQNQITVLHFYNELKKERDNLDTHNDKVIFVSPKFSESNETVELVVGGQAGNYPVKMCVDLLECLLAAITFAESGQLEPSLTWKEDESLVMV